MTPCPLSRRKAPPRRRSSRFVHSFGSLAAAWMTALVRQSSRRPGSRRPSSTAGSGGALRAGLRNQRSKRQGHRHRSAAVACIVRVWNVIMFGVCSVAPVRRWRSPFISISWTSCPQQFNRFGEPHALRVPGKRRIDFRSRFDVFQINRWRCSEIHTHRRPTNIWNWIVGEVNRASFDVD